MIEASITPKVCRGFGNEDGGFRDGLPAEGVELGVRRPHIDHAVDRHRGRVVVVEGGGGPGPQRLACLGGPEQPVLPAALNA